MTSFACSAVVLAAALPVVLGPGAASAAHYELTASSLIRLGDVYTDFTDPTPAPTVATSAVGGASASVGAAEGVYDPGGMTTLNDAALSVTDAAVAGVDTSAALAAVSLGTYAPLTSDAPYPPGGTSRTSIVSIDWRGFLDLSSDMDDWAGARLTFSVLDAATGDVLEALDRSHAPDAPEFYTAVDATQTYGLYVFCGGAASGPVGGSLSFEVIGTGEMSVSMEVAGFAGPADCDDDILYLPPEIAGLAIVDLQAEPFPDVPLPATAPLLLGALAALAARRRR